MVELKKETFWNFWIVTKFMHIFIICNYIKCHIQFELSGCFIYLTFLTALVTAIASNETHAMDKFFFQNKFEVFNLNVQLAVF
jgi:hypothetical protein